MLPCSTGFGIPAETSIVSSERLPSERHVYFYADRAKGGAGLIIGPADEIVHASAGGRYYERAYDRRSVEIYRRIVDAVHQNN